MLLGAASPPLRLRSTLSLLTTSTVSAASIPPQRYFAIKDPKMSAPTTDYKKDDLSPRGEQLIKDAMELFGARPTHEIFSRWRPDATFSDPICTARGAREYKAQWWGMPAAFKESDTLAWYVIKEDDRRIEYVQKQAYVVKGLGVRKEMLSTVVMDLDENGKISNFEDRWDHKPLTSNFLTHALKRLNAVTMPYLISVPPESSAQSGRSDL